MSKNESSAKAAILPLFALDKTSKQIYTENTKSAADERLALRITAETSRSFSQDGAAYFFLFSSCIRLIKATISPEAPIITRQIWQKSFTVKYICIAPFPV